MRRKGKKEERVGRREVRTKRGKRGRSHRKMFSFRAMEASYWVSQEYKDMLLVGLRMKMASE